MFLATIFGFLMDKMAEYRKLEWAVRVFNRPLEHLKQIAALYDPAVAARQGEGVTPERLRQVAEFCGKLAERIETRAEGKTAAASLRQDKKDSATSVCCAENRGGVISQGSKRR